MFSQKPDIDAINNMRLHIFNMFIINEWIPISLQTFLHVFLL